MLLVAGPVIRYNIHLNAIINPLSSNDIVQFERVLYWISKFSVTCHVFVLIVAPILRPARYNTNIAATNFFFACKSYEWLIDE